MFIKARREGNRSEEWTKGLFLILFSLPLGHEPQRELRAAVRIVTMKQLGQFMMSTTDIAGHRISLSGAYGGDGLGHTLKEGPEMDAIWPIALPLPQELYDKWNNGGGHNSTGSEAKSMEKWANENLDALYNVGRAKHSYAYKRFGIQLRRY